MVFMFVGLLVSLLALIAMSLFALWLFHLWEAATGEIIRLRQNCWACRHAYDDLESDTERSA